MKDIISRQEKLDIPYGIKANKSEGQKFEVDQSGRTVNVIGNTYFWFDKDFDVLIPGVAAKSISDRGPKSNLPGKIKHLSNHNLTKGIGRPEIIEETKLNGLDVLRMESFLIETSDGEETLIKYKEGVIDQHSIGFRYLNLEFIESESSAFDDVLNKLINPQDAIDAGFLFLVKEIELFEISSLDGFGSNRLTDLIDIKSDNKTVQYNNLITKLSALHTAMRSGSSDKYTMNLQEKQINQMIYELYHPEPSLKDTHEEPPKGDTFDLGSAIKNLNIN